MVKGKTKQSIKSNIKSPRVCIIIPTYNEAENIEKLVRQILDLAIPNLSIIIVDDNSPDETGKIVEKLKARGPKLRAAVNVIHRKEKLGLGTAYVAGFKQALEDGVDYMITMDADFSHDPNYIPSFIKEAASYDLVLGSRFVKGGKIINWSPLRQILSRSANILTRAILKLPFYDCTSGFKCYSRNFIQILDLDNVLSKGYAFQVEMVYNIKINHFKSTELPITFINRDLGNSKFDVFELLNFTKTVIFLFGRDLARREEDDKK